MEECTSSCLARSYGSSNSWVSKKVLTRGDGWAGKVMTARNGSDKADRSGGRLTVVFLESAATMGGVQRTTLDHVENIDRSRWKPVVICPEEGELTQACRRNGIDVRILPRPLLFSTSFWISDSKKLPNPLAWAWNVGGLLRGMRSVKKLLAQERPDVVMTKGLASHLYGGLAAKRLGIPCLWHAQDFISERFGGIYVRVFGCLARWLPSHIVVIGPQISR